MQSDSSLNETDAFTELWENDALLDQLAREAVQDALREHKRKGQSVVVWQDGKMVILSADEIPDTTAPKAPSPDHVSEPK